MKFHTGFNYLCTNLEMGSLSLKMEAIFLVILYSIVIMLGSSRNILYPSRIDIGNELCMCVCVCYVIHRKLDRQEVDDVIGQD